MPPAASPPNPPPVWLQQAFDQAKAEFLVECKDAPIIDFAKVTTVDDVYREAEEIQKKQAKSRNLRGLGRIKKCLDLLGQYADVIEVFVQVKPDVLALIWGPIKLILKMSSHAVGSFEKFVKVLVDLGNCLPEFELFAGLFRQHERLLKVLVLFYKDVLQVYQIAFNFFKTRWGLIKESLWPRFSAKLESICVNISSHKDLFRSEVTLQEINEAAEARKKHDNDQEVLRLEKDQLNFHNMRMDLAPCLYDDDLAQLLKSSLKGSGSWITQNDAFLKWWKDDSFNQVLWICGIPGAGKTRLAASIIHRLREDENRNTAFVLLRHDTAALNKPVRVLQSLIFQLLSDNATLRPALYEQYMTNYRKLTSSVEFLQNNLVSLADAAGYTHIVVDGLDEVERNDRVELLKSLLDAFQSTPHIKLLISSRKEHEILALLEGKASRIRVNEHNMKDIEQYVEAETHDWISKFRKRSKRQDLIVQLDSSLAEIPAKSRGMFLYARLVLRIVMKHDTIGKALRETQRLPDGLQEAYGRVLEDFARDDTKLRTIQNILRWVGCAMTPLKVQEMLQIIAIEGGPADFANEPVAFRDIEEICSPIIEVRGGFLHFVHFTAKEFFFGDQSEKFLDMEDAHFRAAQTCTIYLSIRDFFESNESLKLAILEGKLVLIQYAYYHWLGHVQYSSFNLSCRQKHNLTRRITRLKDAVAKPDCLHEARPDLPLEFQALAETGGSDMCHFLNCYGSFITRRKLGLLESEGAISLAGQDPTVLSQVLDQSRTILEGLLCDSSTHNASCNCEDLVDIYGDDLFRCDRYYCSRSRVGFSSSEERDLHLREHERSFKCEDLACIFSDLGFRTEVERNKHNAIVHSAKCQQEGGNLRTDMWKDISQKEIETLTLDAIRMDEEALVQALLPHLRQISDDLLLSAGQNASTTIIKHLVSFRLATKANSLPAAELLGIALTGAVMSQSRGKIKELLSLDAANNSRQLKVAAVSTLDLEFLRFLADNNIDFEDVIYDHECIHLLSQKSQTEAVQLLDGLHQYLVKGPDIGDYIYNMPISLSPASMYLVGHYCSARYGFLAGLQWFMGNAKKRIHSHKLDRGPVTTDEVRLARDFLDQEFDMFAGEYPPKFSGTALYVAVSSAHFGNALPGESKKACIARYAACVKYLLRQGADPAISSMGNIMTEIDRTAGAKNLEKHFDKYWQDIVDKYSPGEYFEHESSDSESDIAIDQYYSDTRDNQHDRKRRKRRKESSSKKRRR